MGQGELELGEESPATGDAEDHAPELAQETVPGLGRKAFGALDSGQDGEEAGLAVGREFDGQGQRVNNPPEELLPRRPASVAFGEFLEGDGFSAEGVSGAIGPEHQVIEVEDLAAKAVKARRWALGDEDFVIDENVGVGEGFGVGVVAGAAATERGGSGTGLVEWRVTKGQAGGQTRGGNRTQCRGRPRGLATGQTVGHEEGWGLGDNTKGMSVRGRGGTGKVL
jgi:hypothetical protein